MRNLRKLSLAFNLLTFLPELGGLAALEHLDLSDNKIGSREGGEGLEEDAGESPDGWESITHSPLHELKVLLLANNLLAWTQQDFNTRIAVLQDKGSLQVLDFRGNLMLFSPRLDDLPPLRLYRDWILTKCPRLIQLDGAEVTEQDHLQLALHPLLHEPDALEGGGGKKDGEDKGGSDGLPRSFEYRGQPRSTSLPLLAEMLSETFALPSHLCTEVLERVQTSLADLFIAPPEARFLFPAEDEYDESGRMDGSRNTQGKMVIQAAPVETAVPTGGGDGSSQGDAEAGLGALKVERRRKRIDGESQLRNGTGLLTDEEIERKETQLIHTTLGTREGQRELSKPADIKGTPGDLLALKGPEGGGGAEPASAVEDVGQPKLTMKEKTASRQTPAHVIEDIVQQLQLIFERAPKADLLTSFEAERRNAVEEAVNQAAAGRPLVINKGESLSIAQRAIRLLTTCAALGGSAQSDMLATKALSTLMELLMATEANEELIITEALAFLVPPILSANCKDWIQWSHIGLMTALVSTKPLVGLQLFPLAPTLQRIAVDEMGSAPLPLFTLLGQLARYEDSFPRTKSARPDSQRVLSPAVALHEAGVTGAVVSWLSDSGGAGRVMDSWTPSRRLCVWQIAEGLARHVRPAAAQLVKEGAAREVKESLTDLLKGGQIHLEWRPEKTALVSQLILTAEALGKHIAKARVELFALPSRMGMVLGDEPWCAVFEDDGALLPLVLPMLTDLPARADATLLAALLHLLASLVTTATGAMLHALSEMLSNVHPILKLALPRVEGGFLEDILINAAPNAEDGPIADLGLIDEPSVRRMLLKLTLVMTAYATRAEQWQSAETKAAAGKGPPPDPKWEKALHVTNFFDEEGRDKVIFALLNNQDDELKIAAMECLSKVPTSNLQPDEIKELVAFVHDKCDTYQVYVGRNEELMMHAFNAFARLAKVPDRPESLEGVSEGFRKSAGTHFRRDHADLVQIALLLLVQNSRREIPESASAEREQKAQLSAALTNFLQSCSGPAEGQEANGDAPPVWPQAVSILQMRDATQAMVEVMRNEESYGDAHTELNLERSALADTIEPLLFTLPSVALKSEIKARLLNRLADLLEGDAESGDGGGGEFGGAVSTESANARKRRVQQHVSFLRRNGIDMVLTQLENEMSELRQMQLLDDEENGMGVDELKEEDANALDDILPREANPEVVAEKISNIDRFVEAEEARAELSLTFVGGGEEEKAAEMAGAVKQFVDWRKFGIAALYSQELHMMPDIGDGPGKKGDGPAIQQNSMTAARKTEKELEEEAAHEATWQHAEKAAAATMRILTACVKHGSTETVAAFLDRMNQPSTQNDVLMVAAYAGVFTRRTQSDTSFKFVGLFNEVLRALSQRSLVNTSVLPLLDTLGRLLPKLLLPYAERMGKALDMWKMRCAKDGMESANEELLRGQQVEESRMLASLAQLAGLYSTMLSALSSMRFSKQEPVDGAAKELAMRRLLPPGAAEVTTSATAKSGKDNALKAFLSVLFYDAVLRMAEGWEPSQLVTTSNDSLARQEAVAAIKGVLASFCVLDEERRFELFQLSARLEARWTLALPPALMHAITELTEQALYKRALEPHLLRERIIESEGEFVLEAQWMVQEIPKARAHVLLVITNRALYLMETQRLGGVCQVCESWKLCPSGPKLIRRIALYTVSRLTLDFTVAYNAGHRMKVHLVGDMFDQGFCGVPPISGGGNNGEVSLRGGCGDICCAAQRKPGEPLQPAGEDKGPSEPLVTRRSSRKGGLVSELQFSSLYLGVVQRMANAIRQGHPRPPPITLDTNGPRAIQVHRAQGATTKKKMGKPNELEVQPFSCLTALRGGLEQGRQDADGTAHHDH